MLAVVRGTKRTRYEISSHHHRRAVALYFFLSAVFWVPVVLSCDSHCAVSFQGSFSYYNCACVAKTGKTSREAKKGFCAVDCKLNRTIFLTILGLLPFLTFLNGTPGYIVTLRFVTGELGIPLFFFLFQF